VPFFSVKVAIIACHPIMVQLGAVGVRFKLHSSDDTRTGFDVAVALEFDSI